MSDSVNTREIILDVLLEVNRDGEFSHIAIRNALNKYQFLPKSDRAFITRICEGTIENMIQLDYIINQFSSVEVQKMKPVIQNLLRSGVYQIKYMDSVPVSAVCNEAVKITQKRGFYNLKGFVNAVLRTIARKLNEVKFPTRDDPDAFLSITYSMPKWLIHKWDSQFGLEVTETMLQDFLKTRPTTIRVKQFLTDQEEVLDSIRAQGASVEKAPYLDYARYISGFNYIPGLDAFQEGKIMVQDVSSMLVSEIAAPKRGDYIIDMCAAPGGKSLHLADKMGGFGVVEARDLTEFKIGLIQENIRRADVINVKTKRQDAIVFLPESETTADIVLADVPCSGLGVIGHKTDIKYKINADKQEELIDLQRAILQNAVQYVKLGGTLIYSTCTIGREENQDNIDWILDNFPYELESLDPYISPELRSETTREGYLQLLPGIHACDGFFMARLKRVRMS